ncbi:CHAD domain-containing protein [Gryllotalpicola protaetiae]|uniref:CHAD domain-containing protein n=1 Tax=Gryllotalpicola protaetiae TaxID=2419771 RepID=A0A387BNK8_9MICO|nr:CHAD domain-containing protein [Gryllotalpicola protaetiae]AYG02576.1 CHAD domain-containing protein [Gryllotalpicola protaetiae]
MSSDPSAATWLRDVIDSLIGLGSAVRRDEPDSVHQARTMTRRLRVVIGLVPGDAARPARKELKNYGRALGAARDLEVRAELAARLLDELGDDDDTDAAHQRLVTGVLAEYRVAHARLVEYLDGRAYRRLLTLLEDVADDAEDLDELAVQHEARKHARALRYLAEALADDGTAKLGARLQDAFGEHRDYTLLARSLEGETDRSIAEVRQAAQKRGQASLGRK